MTRKGVLSGGVAVLALLGAVTWLWLSPSGSVRAPAITLTTLEGERIELRSLLGRPVLVNFWATTCRTCMQEMPDLMALHADFAPRGFTVIGVAMPYDRPDQVLRMTQERRFNFPVVLDPQGTAARAFGEVSLTPASFLIAPDGRIAQKVIGKLEFDAVRSQLQAWLGS